MLGVRACAATIAATMIAGAAFAGCIASNEIDYTDRPNDKTVVFHMKDKRVYRNDLPVTCPGLKASIDGFTYQPTDPGTDQLCDNLAVFRLNDVGHATCIFGVFTRVK